MKKPDVQIIGCTFDGNRRHGVNLAGREDFRVVGSSGSNNGADGLHAPAVSEVPSFLQSIGIPADTDPIALAALLYQLRTSEPAVREDLIKESGIFATVLSGLADATAVVANLASIPGTAEAIEFVKMKLGI